MADRFFVLFCFVMSVFVGVNIGVIFVGTADLDYNNFNKKYEVMKQMCDSFGGVESFDLNWQITCKDGTEVSK